MKKQIVFITTLSLLLYGCGSSDDHDENNPTSSPKETVISEIITSETPEEDIEENIEESLETIDYNPGNVLKDYGMETDPEEFYALNDSELFEYVENEVYSDLIKELEGTDYFIENVRTSYVSKEYIEELEYNSKENVLFGYTLSELNDQFQGKRYVFTLGDDWQTQVKEFEEYSDDTYEKALKNVAIGSGVILVCVTVSAVTTTAAPAVSVIMMASAKTGATIALSSGSLAAISSGIITGITTGDMDKALKAAADKGSNSFKWGAISGAIAGGANAGIALHGATLNGLTMNQAAIIQKNSNWSLEVIKNLHSVEEYEIYKKAGLTPIKLNGEWVLSQGVDWDYAQDGITNLQRVLEQGNAPLGPDGKPFELHHIGQRNDSPLAILSHSQHHAEGDFNIIHYLEEGRGNNPNWAKQKREFWKLMAETYMKEKGVL